MSGEDVEKDELQRAEEALKRAERSAEIIHAFAPIRFFLVLIGQMPFQIKKQEDGTYLFKLSFTGGAWLLFVLMFTVNTAYYLMVTAGVVSFVFTKLDYYSVHKPTFKLLVKDPVTGVNEQQLQERYLTRKQMVPVFVIWSWMTISFVSSLQVLLYGKYYAHYINYFNKAAQKIEVEMATGLRRYVMKSNLITFSAVLLFCALWVIEFLTNYNTIGETSLVLSNFFLRLLRDSGDLREHRGLEIFGLVMMIYAMVCSRANIMQFLFFVRLLRNGSQVWNQRLTYTLERDHKTLTKSMRVPDRDQYHRRLNHNQILEDHHMLVQLFNMTQNVFGFVLLTYYFLEAAACVMEIYKLAALGGFDNSRNKGDDDDSGALLVENENEDVFDADTVHETEVFSEAVVTIILFAQHVLFAILTTLDVASSSQQAIEGFNILRRHGFMFCRNKSERNFVWTLYMSFPKCIPMELQAGTYFSINRALMVAMATAIVSWSVSIYQTKIDQWK